MADVVIGVGASHTTLMNTHWAQVAELDRAHRFRNGLLEAKELIARAAPDAIIIVGSNHFRGFWLDLMPAFTIGVGAITSCGEHGTPEGELPSDPAFAGELCDKLIAGGFDPAFSASLTVDHGISHAAQWLVPDPALPIIPIVVNCFAPPLPTLQRTRAFGEQLGSAVRAAAAGRRVAVIATGGLSHQLPFPDWRAPEGENDEFLVDSWLNGRGHWQDYNARRREIILAAPSRINEDFDRAFLSSIEAGTARRFPDTILDQDLIRTAGNGSNEVRAWQIMSAVMNYAPGRVLAYSPMPEWLTGMGVAAIEPD